MNTKQYSYLSTTQNSQENTNGRQNKIISFLNMPSSFAKVH